MSTERIGVNNQLSNYPHLLPPILSSPILKLPTIVCLTEPRLNFILEIESLELWETARSLKRGSPLGSYGSFADEGFRLSSLKQLSRDRRRSLCVGNDERRRTVRPLRLCSDEPPADAYRLVRRLPWLAQRAWNTERLVSLNTLSSPQA